MIQIGNDYALIRIRLAAWKFTGPTPHQSLQHPLAKTWTQRLKMLLKWARLKTMFGSYSG
jgi:hypothetical protein